MGTHRWKDRLYPPLVVVVVVAAVWYAAEHRNDSATAVQASTSNTPAQAQTPATTDTAAPLTMPTIEKMQGKVKFAIDTTKVKNIQKVEFYVGSQLMGAAYGEPYTVTVDETNLKPGTHQVTAKVYTDDTTTETPPASFTSQTTTAVSPSSPTAKAPDTTNSVPTSPVSEPVATPAAYAPDVPQNVTATFDPDNGSVQVSWDAPNDGTVAASYQIWRSINGSSNLIANMTTTNYTDVGLAPGSYQYTVIAVDAENNISQPSDPSSLVNVPDNSSNVPANAPASAGAQ